MNRGIWKILPLKTAVRGADSFWLVRYAGIDARIWEQAKLDNPDPARMIPVPIVGFDELHQRLRLQEQQANLQQARLDVRRLVVVVVVVVAVCHRSSSSSSRRHSGGGHRHRHHRSSSSDSVYSVILAQPLQEFTWYV